MKLECILLIDDDLSTNFINKRIIESVGIDTHIEVFESGDDALEYLKNNDKNPQPGLIFLDLNMPGMDGWEFLDCYEELAVEKQANSVLSILSTSINPDDKFKADQRKSVESFLSKPLRTEDINALVERHFSN